MPLSLHPFHLILGNLVFLSDWLYSLPAEPLLFCASLLCALLVLFLLAEVYSPFHCTQLHLLDLYSFSYYLNVTESLSLMKHTGHCTYLIPLFIFHPLLD